MKKISLDKKFINRWLNRFEFKLKRTKLFSKPIFLTIEPTNACNSRCIMCNKLNEYASSDFKAGFMSRNIFEKILPCVSFASSVCWGGFGEPFLHPNYGEWAEDLKNAGADLICFTNGIKLNRSLAEKLVDIQFDSINISIGGATEDVYKAVRGVNGLMIMLKNLNYLNEVKRTNCSIKPIVNFNIVAMNTVLPQLIEIVNLAHKNNITAINMPDLNVQYVENIKESIWTNIETAKQYIDEAEQYAKKMGISFSPPTTEEHKGDCQHFFDMMQITYDGIVLSCPEERYNLGNLNLKSINEIWNDEFYRRLRCQYLEHGNHVICKSCIEWDKSKETMLNASLDIREMARIYEEYS